MQLILKDQQHVVKIKNLDPELFNYLLNDFFLQICFLLLKIFLLLFKLKK